MSRLDDLPLHRLQFYLTASYPCSYLTERRARSQVAAPVQLIDADVYGVLVEHGFRRSGFHAYRPLCEHCRACVPVRVDVANFGANRNQRRAWQRHQTLVATPFDLAFVAAHHDLYQRYQRARHAGGGMDQDDREQYSQFLLHSNVNSHLIEFREAGALRMVSLIDLLADGASSVYTFFDPEVAGASYGTYAVLWQIELCRRLGLRWLYLGYRIAECRKMAYKVNFQPLQGLIDGAWRPLTEAET